MRRQLLLLSLLVILPALHAVAQASLGVVVYAEGGEITILRDEEQIDLDAGSGEALGEPVYADDQVTTGENTFAEIQLLTSRNVVKIAESTTFTLASVEDGRSSLGLTYGRLRARVERLAGTDGFELRGITASAGVRGTDFAYDQVLDPSTGELYNRVSCFDGEVIVSAIAQPELSVVIGPGEAVFAPVGASPQEAVIGPVPEEVQAFWADRPFVRQPAAPADVLDEFPGLRERASKRLGVLPEAEPVVGSGPAEDGASDDGEDATASAEGEAGTPESDEPAAAPAPTVTEQETARGAGEDASPEGEPGETPPDDTARRERVARAFRTTGIVLAGAGLMTDIAAIGLFYFGEDVVPGWTAANNDALRPVAIAGVGMLTGGLISIVVSLAVSP
ncbi:MAG: FecR domain-containing protein [Spirochaetota bacterium]